MSKENGGTRIVPGSHLFGRHPDKVLDKDIEVISAEGPPGCAIITDGRVSVSYTHLTLPTKRIV